MNHEEGQTLFFAAAKLFWPEGCLRDFFWPEEGRRPSEGQKNPSNSLKHGIGKIYDLVILAAYLMNLATICDEMGQVRNNFLGLKSAPYMV